MTNIEKEVKRRRGGGGGGGGGSKVKFLQLKLSLLICSERWYRSLCILCSTRTAKIRETGLLC